jgi:cell division protein ZapD
MIYYDHPMNEQVRLLLRLNDLFVRIFSFLNGEDANHHHVALMSLFEVLAITERAEVKSELLMALERQRSTLLSLKDNEKVSQDRLGQALSDLQQAQAGLHESRGKFGEHLRNHEWLSTIRQRAAVPGGLSSFDSPLYYHWLCKSADERRQNLRNWLAPMLPVCHALEVQLKLLRDGGTASSLTAVRGTFRQERLGNEVKLLSVGIDESLPCVPEISANRYLLNIRFIGGEPENMGQLYAQDVPFRLEICLL